MKVIKSDGRKQEIDYGKIRRSIKRTGAKPDLVEDVVRRVEKRVKDGMTTREVYNIVREELRTKNICVACRYDLREALFRLGPAGFKFEQYVASILKAYEYDAYVPEEELEGSCVMHEVDVIAKKDNRSIFIEAKFRNDSQHYVNLKDTMATWSRFLDLVDGSLIGKCLHFDEVWIVTNARFSDRARQFGICKGMHLIGWSFPKEHSFENMVDHTALYPLTAISDLSGAELDKFSENDLMLCREVSKLAPEKISKLVGISETRAQEIVKNCNVIINPPE